MSMYTPPQRTSAAGAHHTLAQWCAWTSLALPLLAGAMLLFVRPMHIMAPQTVYWTMFACGVISIVVGCVGVSTIGRQIDWSVLTPSILGIVLSVILSYLSMGLGILSIGPAPPWNEIFPWQGPPPAAPNR